MKFSELIEYLRSINYLRKIGYAVTFAVLFLFFSFQFLNVFTHHGKSKTVPDIRGKTLEEAELEIRKRRLRFVVFDSVYNTEYPRGTVVDQHPKALFKVKKHRKIFLTMNAVAEEKIKMPNLIGITLREARTKMENIGLRVGELIYIYDIAKNVILDQKYKGGLINEGDSIVKGSYIDLVLGKGLSDITTTVPDLFGLSIDEAKVKASDRYFSLGHVTFDSTIMNIVDSLDARIFMQEPRHHPNIRVPLGSPIYVWVTADSLKLLNSHIIDSDSIESAYLDEI